MNVKEKQSNELISNVHLTTRLTAALPLFQLTTFLLVALGNHFRFQGLQYSRKKIKGHIIDKISKY